MGTALLLAATTLASPAAAECFGGYEEGVWHNTQGDSPYEIEVVQIGCIGESELPFRVSIREHEPDGQLFLRGTFPAKFVTEGSDAGWIVVDPPYSDGGYLEHPKLHLEGSRLLVTIFYESLDSKPSATVTQMFARWDTGVGGIDDPLVLPAPPPAPARFISAALDVNGVEMTYFFRGGRYGTYDWDLDELTETGLLPQLISAPPLDFQNGFDTALSGWGAFSNKSYFFKGSTYFRYDWSGQVDSIAPIEDWGFPPGFNANLNAAINGVGAYEGKAYLFKSNQYIRFDWATGTVDPGYPRFISAEWHLPPPFDSGVDAAANGRGPYEGKTYFFKGTQYVRYDWTANAVDPGYPRDTASNWAALAPL